MHSKPLFSWVKQMGQTHGWVESGNFPTRFGRYVLLSKMAVGGMAEVLLAVEETEHAGRRFVTIKRIRQEHCQDPDYIEFFLTEGRVALKCAHPNLPHAFDLGVISGLHFLAMEYIRGHTLLDIVRAAAASGTRISTRAALRIGASVSAALEYVHGLCDVDGRSLKVVHRDVTPQNIMVAAVGPVKLIDFGIVRSTVQTHRTQNGVVKGKFAYLAPETIATRGSIDQRADLFSLGVCLHEILTARPLFRGQTDEDTLQRLRYMEVPDLSELRDDVPPPLAKTIKKALERDPDKRFQTATEFLHALDEVAEECNIHHSVTRLRDEIVSLCGPPPLPMVDAPVVRALTEEAAAAMGVVARPEDETPHTDERLAYFLSKASETQNDTDVSVSQID
jgi:serine/threonine-protein kinase